MEHLSRNPWEAAMRIHEESRFANSCAAFPCKDLLLVGEFGILDLFKRCKAITAEAHFLPSALAHVGIIRIVKLIEQDEVGNCVFAAGAAGDFHATDTDVPNRVNSVFARKLSVEAPDGGAEVVVDAGYLLTSIEHGSPVSGFIKL